MGVEHANPEITGYGIDFSQQACQRFAPGGVHPAGLGGLLLPFVHTVVGGILSDEVNLAAPTLHQGAHLAQDISLRATAVTTAYTGNHAVGAGVVAPLGNFDICRMRGRQAVASITEIGHEF